MNTAIKLLFIALMVVVAVVVVHPPKKVSEPTVKLVIEDLTKREMTEAMLLIRSRGFECGRVDNGYVSRSVDTALINCDNYKHKYSIVKGKTRTIKEIK